MHGHDAKVKEAVARFVKLMDLEPIILHEQSNKGETIIGKFEKHLNEVGYAIILYTPCDIGGKDANNLTPRPRQNVVFEHGYCVAKLGRANVCVLFDESVNKPSDIDGVLYIPLKDDAWRILLAKEMTAVGYDIDFNKLFK